MINIVDMARGMESIKNFYGCKPIEIKEVNFKDYAYMADITLKNGDEWKIDYAGQAKLIKQADETITNREIRIVMNALSGYPTIATAAFADKVERILKKSVRQ